LNQSLRVIFASVLPRKSDFSLTAYVRCFILPITVRLQDDALARLEMFLTFRMSLNLHGCFRLGACNGSHLARRGKGHINDLFATSGSAKTQQSG
jgi:hypothetical protein